MEKSIQISVIIKYQKKVLNKFACQQFYSSVYKKGKNYYPLVFLEKCKYVIKEKKKSIKTFITDSIEISSDKENSDEEN